VHTTAGILKFLARVAGQGRGTVLGEQRRSLQAAQE